MNRFKGLTPFEKKLFLEDYYVEKRLTLRQIARLTGVTAEAIHYWVKKFKLNQTKIVSILLLLWGLTFLYQPSTGDGWVFINNSKYNGIMIVDTEQNSVNFYSGEYISSERLDSTLKEMLEDIQRKGGSFKSVITPLRKGGIRY